MGKKKIPVGKTKILTGKDLFLMGVAPKLTILNELPWVFALSPWENVLCPWAKTFCPSGKLRKIWGFCKNLKKTASPEEMVEEQWANSNEVDELRERFPGVGAGGQSGTDSGADRQPWADGFEFRWDYFGGVVGKLKFANISASEGVTGVAGKTGTGLAGNDHWLLASIVSKIICFPTKAMFSNFTSLISASELT
jgi:hypothetical protein